MIVDAGGGIFITSHLTIPSDSFEEYLLVTCRDANGGGIIYHSCSRPMGTEPGVLSFLNIFLGSHLSLLQGPVNPHEWWNYALQSRCNSS
jgi:hypothetical protein